MKPIKKLFLFLLTLSLTLSCKTIKKPVQGTIKTVQLNIIEIRKGEPDSPSDIFIDFEIVNNTKEAFYIPKPLELIKYSYVILPEFFDIDLNGYECEQGMIFNDGSIKGNANFVKVEANTKTKFTINPSRNIGLECIVDSEAPQILQLRYMPNPEELTSEFVKINYKRSEDLESLIEIYSNVLKDTISSEPFLIE